MQSVPIIVLSVYLLITATSISANGPATQTQAKANTGGNEQVNAGDQQQTNTGTQGGTDNVIKTLSKANRVSIPNTFYYNCTGEGEIEIINDNGFLENMRILNKSSNHCPSPRRPKDSRNVFINQCDKTTPVDIVFEVSNITSVVGGQHFKTFQIKCDDVNIEPYFLNVTAKQVINVPSVPTVINMGTTPTPSPITDLTMLILDKQHQSVQQATIGQELTIAISTPGKVTIKPTECEATGDGQKVTMWKETGCYHNAELFGGKWTNSADKTVTNTMYGFRFVGASNSISIRCNVRVCPEGYTGDECHLDCTTTKRKRVHRLPIGVTTKMLTTSLSIKDSVLTTSGSGRLESKLSRIIGLSAIVFVFVKSNFFRG